MFNLEITAQDANIILMAIKKLPIEIGLGTLQIVEGQLIEQENKMKKDKPKEK